MTGILFFIGIFVISYFGVGLFLRWSLRRQLLDIPNERSSHSSPTPRGAGVVIVVVSLVSYVSYCVYYGASLHWGYLAGALVVAAISWLDDVYSVSFVWRFFAHSIAAGLVIYDAGYWQSIYLPFVDIKLELASAGALLTFLWIVWLTNAYNFMDGIDGIAGVQALTAGIGWLLIGYLIGFPIVSFYGGALAFSTLGFLFYNWQPARIFLGDVGSAFLGFTFAVIPLLAGAEHSGKAAPLPVIGVLLVWFFVFDTVITFFSRLIRRHKVWTPHREHLYQKLIISGLSHSTVSLLYGFLSLAIVLSLILASALRGSLELVLLAIIIVETSGLVILAFTRKVLT